MPFFVLQKRRKTEFHWIRTPGLAENTRDFKIQWPNGNDNVQENNRFNKQNNNFACASYFFVHFFAIFSQLQHEIA